MLPVLQPPENTQTTGDSFLAQKPLPPAQKTPKVYIILTETGTDSKSKKQLLEYRSSWLHYAHCVQKHWGPYQYHAFGAFSD